MQAPEPNRLRVSDEERHAVSELLRQAAGEGRIDLEELEERLEATYAAKTYADLLPLTEDLPEDRYPGQAVLPRPAPQPVNVPTQAGAPLGPPPSRSIAVMSETRRTGVWHLVDGHAAFALMGSVVLDLRQAQFAAREVTINANALMGSVDVWVNPATQVSVEGLGIMGEFNESLSKVDAEFTADSPVLRVRGLALMGSVTVKRKSL